MPAGSDSRAWDARPAGGAPWGRLAELLAGRERLQRRLESGARVGRLWVELSAVIVLGGALYGAVIGSWTGPRMALYAAVKLPLVLEITAALTVLFAWMVARLAGVQLSLPRVVVLSAVPLAAAAVVLLSLIPVAGFFTYCARPADLTARETHNLLYLMHTGFVGAAGLAGTAVLLEALNRMGLARRRTLAVFTAWVLSYAVVGGEVAWALRPFVGSVYMPVAFLRPDALDGNVYEFLFADILPFLLGAE